MPSLFQRQGSYHTLLQQSIHSLVSTRCFRLSLNPYVLCIGPWSHLCGYGQTFRPGFIFSIIHMVASDVSRMFCSCRRSLRIISYYLHFKWDCHSSFKIRNRPVIKNKYCVQYKREGGHSHVDDGNYILKWRHLCAATISRFTTLAQCMLPRVAGPLAQ